MHLSAMYILTQIVLVLLQLTCLFMVYAVFAHERFEWKERGLAVTHKHRTLEIRWLGGLMDAVHSDIPVFKVCISKTFPLSKSEAKRVRTLQKKTSKVAITCSYQILTELG